MAFALANSPVFLCAQKLTSRVCFGRRLNKQTTTRTNTRSSVLASATGERVVQEEPQVDTDADSSEQLQRYFDTYKWRGHSINYRVEGPDTGADPVLIIHGFGASINHWRKNIPAMVDTQKLQVYAIDLLGFGGSDKSGPEHVDYGLPLWKDLVCDFVHDMKPTAKWSLIGNSIGSLIALMAADELGEQRVRSLCLMNCAGGLVSFRYSELNPFEAGLLWFFNTILFNKYTGPILFENFRKRSNVANVLKQVYTNEHSITGDLLDILCEPAMDEGACEVFLAILNADPGPSPEELLPKLTWCPMLVIWGAKDPWTPLEQGFHPGIKFPEYHPGMDLEVIPNAGHCIHDECPDRVNEIMVPFLLSPVLKKTVAKGVY